MEERKWIVEKVVGLCVGICADGVLFNGSFRCFCKWWLKWTLEMGFASQRLSTTQKDIYVTIIIL